jgi:hypothetical protein
MTEVTFTSLVSLDSKEMKKTRAIWRGSFSFLSTFTHSEMKMVDAAFISLIVR